MQPTSKDNNTILLFIKVPPPVTGPTLINKRVLDSSLLRDTFNVRSIEISYMQNLEDMGKWKLLKLCIFITKLCKLSIELTLHRLRFVYFQLSPNGFAFVRDLVFVTLIKLFRVRIVFHIHGKGIINKSKYAKIFYKYCFKNEYLICLTSLLTYDVKDVFYGRIFIVPNGITAANTEKRGKTNNEIPNILYLSNLILSKGIMDFVSALGILNHKGLEFNGIIVGAELDISSDALQLALKNKGLDEKVRYFGPRFDNEKQEILFNSDIFVFPTKEDCFPLVIQEAMQFGLPVVSTYEAAIPEIVDDGVTGFLVEKDAPEQVAEKIEYLINDPELRQKMGEAGSRKYEAKYTIKHFEENMKKVFQEVLDDISNQRN